MVEVAVAEDDRPRLLPRAGKPPGSDYSSLPIVSVPFRVVLVPIGWYNVCDNVNCFAHKCSSSSNNG